MRKTLAAVITATTAAATISGVGLASASTTSARPATPVEHFQIMSTSSTASTNSLVAWGAFAGGGTDIVHANGSETYRFANGSFVVVPTPGSVKSFTDSKTCFSRVMVQGTYVISQGTGKFAGITGSGTARVSLLSAEPRVNGACSATAAPTSFQELVQLSGPFSM
ncbi:MAG TPA: hypothetical protein VGL63_09380 [Streptosporangiaceae bacterium]|jgi:hypothetical protein